jgi:hypothetical protein
MEERPIPKIHVMPGEYRAALPVARVSRRTLLISGVSIGFVIVVGSAAWYFTAGLRVPQIAAPLPVVQAPVETPVVVPPVEATTPTPPVETPVVVTPPASMPNEDTDSDGLTNAEEQVLTTLPNNPDTDNDGFLDGHEALNLYNPGGFQPERLVDTPQKLSFFYPAPWSITSADELGTDITVTSLTGETFTLKVIANEKAQTVENWYQEQNTSASSPATPVKTKAGIYGILAVDGRAAFFAHGGSIIAIQYNTTAEGPLLYPHLFEMMLVSLVFSGA